MNISKIGNSFFKHFPRTNKIQVSTDSIVLKLNPSKSNSNHENKVYLKLKLFSFFLNFFQFSRKMKKNIKR